MQTSPSRPKILLSPEREAWYDEAFRVSRQAIDEAKARVIETAKAKGVGGDEGHDTTNA